MDKGGTKTQKKKTSMVPVPSPRVPTPRPPLPPLRSILRESINSLNRKVISDILNISILVR